MSGIASKLTSSIKSSQYFSTQTIPRPRSHIFGGFFIRNPGNSFTRKKCYKKIQIYIIPWVYKFSFLNPREYVGNTFKLPYTSYLWHVSMRDTSQKNHNKNFIASSYFVNDLTYVWNTFKLTCTRYLFHLSTPDTSSINHNCYLFHLSIRDTKPKNHNQNFTASSFYLTNLTSITYFIIAFLYISLVYGYLKNLLSNNNVDKTFPLK